METEELHVEIEKFKCDDLKIQQLVFSENIHIKNTIALVLYKKYKIRVVDLSKEVLIKDDFFAIPKEFAIKNNIIVFKKDIEGYYVAMVNPFNKVVMEELKFFLKDNIILCVCEKKEILKAIHEIYIKKECEIYKNKEIIRENIHLDKNMPMVDFTNEILERAILNGASDIHIEPMTGSYRIRERINGVLSTKTKVNMDTALALISRIKIEAKMDISQKLLPQDGKMVFKNYDKYLDLRVSSMPSFIGEKIVIRILAKQSKVSIDSLGFKEAHNIKLKEHIKKQGGIILVTGPTGSGKSTTLYSLISEMKKDELNIVTIEDPVEYKMNGILQIQVNAKAGLNFPTILRSLLRQDPDVIMIGEIRDEETADIALNAAVTGHLVLATLHTRDALGTLSRLYNMNVPKYMLLETVNLIIAQRLVKTKCICNMSIDGRKERCSLCNNTGYGERKIIYEFLDFTKEIREFIEKHNEISDVRKYLNNIGFMSLEENAMELYKNGEIDLEEVKIFKN